MALVFEAVTVDARDPKMLAEFWAAALDWTIGGQDGDVEVWITPSRGNSKMKPSEILFLKNSDVKSVKNRLHFDLRPDNQSEEVARLERLGAHCIDIGQSNYLKCTWIVMSDPEGNEFCVLSDVSGARD